MCKASVCAIDPAQKIKKAFFFREQLSRSSAHIYGFARRASDPRGGCDPANRDTQRSGRAFARRVAGSWPFLSDEFDEAIAGAKQHGFEYMVFNYLPPKERGGLDFYRSLADKLNLAGEKCRRAGLRLCYHNHDFEFGPKPGGRPFEILLHRLDKSLVGLEVDAFWVSMAGENAAAFIRQNADRVEMLHLKDRKPGAPRAYDVASVPNDTFREVGNGDLNFREILSAASRAGVKHYFVEQDYSPDPLRSLRQSYQNVRKLGFFS
jgi:sugar phosphate isomerase/epimerase